MAEKKRFEQLLRPVYEARAAIVWGVASLWMIGVAFALDAPKPALAACALLALSMTGMRFLAANKLLKYKMSLLGQPTVVMPASRLQKSMHKLGSNLWLGWGYRWEPRHTQRAYEIMKRDLVDVYPPPWWLKWRGDKRDPLKSKGLPWIHGLDMGEKDVVLPFDSLKGHCAIIATTGAIKTRLAALVIFQLAMRGDCVIVIDPKGDKDLREICRQAAILSGKPERFLMLHPAFASESVRLDLIKNWDRVSQVASRITMVLDSQESDNFKEFCWMAVHRITNAMKYVGRRVSIYTLKTAMESRTAVEALTTQALKKFFEDECPDLHEALEKQINALASAGGKPQKGGVETSSPELAAMIKVFQEMVPENEEEARLRGLPIKPEELRGLIAILEANREWFGKMIVSITPMLTKLTTDDLKGLLSPDYDDINDTRPIMDGKRIVEGNHILYIGTDTLADESVGRAISTMALAELSAVAAEIYNHGTAADTGEEPRRVHVVIDEWGDAVCAPVIQQANKGRGAGFFIWALGQTFSDLVDKFQGNTARAKRFIGNMNNMIVGATQDPDTMALITEKLGETTITVRGQSTGIGSKTEDVGLEFSANSSTSISEKDKEIFPRSLLPSLQDLHYIGFFNRGELVKGRIPVIVEDKRYRKT
ncbi:MAG: conjugative transfer system coupling protein TraD [Hydrogenophaga sp.]|jgi:conjugal transfer pilus assembly protein TraD|uniref:conjugative transfer system coupling protein TraD n=1 Tax=Hydrogenophaga sp. TaxID=1904254 RepID=UPI002634F322|nr:conjugative transfer system coupling protein TraD [Hydrogenophaga sp.]MCV0439011.1 conjugative transfer system coupling protein TraD [Hydrogenophaga sp.]